MSISHTHLFIDDTVGILIMKNVSASIKHKTLSLNEIGQRRESDNSHTNTDDLIPPPPSFTIFHPPALLLDPGNFCFLMRDSVGIHLSGVFVCVQYHYSDPGQIINACCSGCFGHQSSGLTGIPREIILLFAKQTRVNKVGRETKQKQEESCQESTEEQIRAYLVPAGKEILRIYIYICVYLSTFALQNMTSISLFAVFFHFYFIFFYFSEEGIFSPTSFPFLAIAFVVPS